MAEAIFLVDGLAAVALAGAGLATVALPVAALGRAVFMGIAFASVLVPPAGVTPDFFLPPFEKTDSQPFAYFCVAPTRTIVTVFFLRFTQGYIKMVCLIACELTTRFAPAH